MPIQNAQTITFRPRGLSDARDGTNVPEGAMRSLINLIPDDSIDRVFSCRPAAISHITFGSFDNPGFVSGGVIIGNIGYGLIASDLTPGFDEPFAYNLLTRARLPVSGITADNVPANQPTSGDWVPPQFEQIGSRVVVTDDHFSGTAQFTTTGIGNTVTGTQTITGNPDILGVLPGMTITGTGIPAGTTITAVTPFQLTTTGDMHTNTIVDNIAEGTTDLAVNQLALGQNVPAAAFIASVDSATQVTLSAATTVTAAAQGIVFAGATITLSAPTTATGDGATFTITGHPLLFGWFDVSGFTQTVYGNTISGSPIVTGTPSVLGVQPGMTVVGTGIPANTTVLGTAPFVLVTTGLTVTGSSLVQNIANTRGIQTGMEVFGLGVQPGTVVVSQAFGSRVLLNKPVSIGAVDTTLTFTGASITLSDDASATADGVSLVISGGTRAAPQWGAGDTDRNGLPSIPVGVARLNGRAYFADGFDGIPFSDSGFACRRSNTLAVQALTTDDGLAVTAIASLMLSSPLVTTGIVAAVIVFEGEQKMQQITGDQVTGDLRMNAMNVATGTLSPNSIAPSEFGLFFMSPHGLRLVDFTAKISPPLGDAGKGISVPFIEATVPSRIAAAANADVLRISVPDGVTQEFSEYWYDLTRQVWTGPHSFPANGIQPWGTTFIITPAGIEGALWKSDVTQRPDSVYIENGVDLTVTYEPIALPDTGQMAMNACCEMIITCRQAEDTDILIVEAADIDGTELDETFVGIAPFAVRLQQRPVYWHVPLIFKQIEIKVRAPSSASLQLGNLYMRYEILGYTLDDGLQLGPDGIFILDESLLSGPDIFT